MQAIVIGHKNPDMNSITADASLHEALQLIERKQMRGRNPA